MAQQTETRVIKIRFDEQGADGLKKAVNSLASLNKTTKSLSTNMNYLTGAFNTWIGYLGVREITQMADSMQNLENRLKIVTQDGKDSALVLEDIRQVANRTYQPIADVGEAYTRMAGALKSTKATTEELTVLTETLINTFRVAGTTTTETTNTLIQLSQAFSSGQLRGQELRSVMEQNAFLAGILRKEFGTNIYKKAEEGAIKASDVTKVLADNLSKINIEAKKLTPTFEQTANVAKNDMYVAIHNVNKELELSINFFKLVNWAVENFKTLLVATIPLIIALGYTHLATLTTQVGSLSLALKSLFLTNPIGWAIVAGAGFVYLTEQVGGLENMLLLVDNIMKELIIKFYTFNMAIYDLIGAQKTSIKFYQEIKKLREEQEINLNTAGNSIYQKGLERQNALMEEQAKQQKALKKLRERQLADEKDLEGKLPKLKTLLGQINKEYNNQIISISEYNEKLINFELYKVNREFEEGKYNIFEFHKRLNELKIDELERQLRVGVVTLQEFRTQVNAIKTSELKEKFDAGKLSLAEYNKELLKVSEGFAPGSALIVGTSNYIESVGTLAENTAKSIDSVFSALEDSLVDMMKTGQFNFKQFAQSILDDLNRIIVRALIIRPIADGILGGIGGSTGFSGTGGAGGSGTSAMAPLPYAKGGAFNNGVQFFAKGGVFDGPTGFGMRGGMGIAGEAGPEAILPLRRGSGGDLGVAASVTPVTINIINQSGANVSQTETTGPNGEKAIEIMIQSKVNDGIARGSFDKTMGMAYGLRRKGS